MTTPLRKRFQMSLGTLLLIVAAFAFGFVARNIADGLHPAYIGLTLPASTSPVRIGEVLSIESLVDSSINREVTVLSDGTINLPMIGVVDVKNKSPAQIQTTLNKSFQQYYAAPGIQVYRSAASRSR